MNAPPKSPPSNLTVVTVEGCPSFVILDWEKTDNDTTGTIRNEQKGQTESHNVAYSSYKPKKNGFSRTLQNIEFLFSEYEVISTAKGPDGEQVSVLTTNQTHTAVENLKPESRYAQHQM